MTSRISLAVALWGVFGLSSAQALRDPTAPPASSTLATRATPVPGAVVAPAGVTAIRVGPDRNVAIIGGQKVQVGDVVAEGTVKAIRRHEVVLHTATGNRVLKLYPGVVKQAHAANVTKKVAQGKPAPLASSTGDSAQ